MSDHDKDTTWCLANCCKQPYSNPTIDATRAIFSFDDDDDDDDDDDFDDDDYDDEYVEQQQ